MLSTEIDNEDLDYITVCTEIFINKDTEVWVAI